MARYEKLKTLFESKNESFVISFSEIEKIIEGQLPPSAFKHSAWWSNSESHQLMKMVIENNWKSRNLDLSAQTIEFFRSKESELLRFLKNTMPIRMKANYQPIVIKSLLESGEKRNFSLSVNEIEKQIELLNFDRKYSIRDAIKAVSGAIQKVCNFDGENFSLKNSEDFKNDIDLCIKLCGQKIAWWHVNEIMKNEISMWRVLPGSTGSNYKFEQEFLESQTIGIDYGMFDDLTDLSIETVKELIKKSNQEGATGSITSITHKMNPKDLVVITRGNKEIIDFGIITSNYIYDNSNSSYSHRRGVYWLKQGPVTAKELPEIDSEEVISGPQTVFELKDNRKKLLLNYLIGDIMDGEYFILRHESDSKWDDSDGRDGIIKYHFSRNVPNQKKIRSAGVGTKTIWFTKRNGEYYFWGYGTVLDVETVKEDEEWNLTYENLKYFDQFEDSIESEGKYLKHATKEIQSLIEQVENFNNQHSITKITKEIFNKIVGDNYISSTNNTSSNTIDNYEKFFRLLENKKQFYFYGPPGTGKTYTAKKIASEFIKKSEIKLMTDDEYNNYVISILEKFANQNEYELRKLTNNQIILKSDNSEIRIYINYSKSGKQTPHDCYVGISKSVIEFLGEVPEDNRFIIIINNDVKNFITTTHKFIIKNLKLSSGENWDSNGNEEHSFHIHVFDDSAIFRANENFSEKYVNCSELLGNIQQIFNSDAITCKRIENITFHQSFSYEEFIEGIRPKVNEKINQISYPIEDGIFKRFSNCANIYDKENFVLIIDEINRGNISKIFGELITLIENDKRGQETTLPYSKNSFAVPKNLFIIGTMNTSDRSLVHIDAALKRRFGQYELLPDYELLDAQIDNIHLGKLLNEINNRIINSGFRDNQIGHSFFMKDGVPITNMQELQFVFAYEIIPLLKDNFYDDDKILRNILGEEFLDENRNILNNWTEDETKFSEIITKTFTN